MQTLSNKIYDWCKVIGQILLPAILTFVSNVYEALGVNAEVFIKIFSAFIVLYNVFIVAWNKVYYDEQNSKALEEKELG